MKIQKKSRIILKKFHFSFSEVFRNFYRSDHHQSVVNRVVEISGIFYRPDRHQAVDSLGSRSGGLGAPFFIFPIFPRLNKMPVRRGNDGHGPFYQWGNSGKRYYYVSNNPASRERARRRAEAQAAAIYSSGWREK